MAQEEFGHTRLLNGILKREFDLEIDPLADERPPAAFASIAFLDHPLESWAELVAANAVVDLALSLVLSSFAGGTFQALARAVPKMLLEERFHAEHAEGWVRLIESESGPSRDALRRALGRALADTRLLRPSGARCGAGPLRRSDGGRRHAQAAALLPPGEADRGSGSRRTRRRGGHVGAGRGGRLEPLGPAPAPDCRRRSGSGHARRAPWDEECRLQVRLRIGVTPRSPGFDPLPALRFHRRRAGGSFGGSLMSRQYYCRACRTVFEWIKWEPGDPAGWLEE